MLMDFVAVVSPVGSITVLFPSPYNKSIWLKFFTVADNSEVKDCATRWGSKQKMVERILEQVPAIRRVLDDRRHHHLNPRWQDIAVLESVNAALKPAAEFTDLLSGESYVTVSSVKPVLKLLTEDIIKPSNEDTTLTSDIKQKMCSVLLEKYELAAFEKTFGKALFLDPRYRGIIFLTLVKNPQSSKRCWECRRKEEVVPVNQWLQMKGKLRCHLQQRKRLLETC
ncbi:uncharacterized protein LOC130565609 isoform X2 [Triplophysa rosa]|uniref:uncharacterized protein LOC130565609 isoform X2 n=1 Tax=Triplophysa rosa TaxID=992332 RepID=UPI002545E935|nr:uncharacterized protein LOC130565609 isoform X2 [Triplophysa rosa]